MNIFARVKALEPSVRALRTRLPTIIAFFEEGHFGATADDALNRISVEAQECLGPLQRQVYSGDIIEIGEIIQQLPRPSVFNECRNIGLIRIEHVDASDYVLGITIDQYRSRLPCLLDYALDFLNFKKTMQLFASLRIYEMYRDNFRGIIFQNMKTDIQGNLEMAGVDKRIDKFLVSNGQVPQYLAWTHVVTTIASSEEIIAFSLFDDARSQQPMAANGIEFENYVCARLEEQGAVVSRTPKTGDFGVDLVVELHDLRYAVQCKDYRRPVGVKAVQEVSAGARHYRCDYGVVVSNGEFTDPARELAASLKIALLNVSEVEKFPRIHEFL